MGKRFQMNKAFKDLGKKHQEIIRKRAMKNPVEAYFLGGFDLLPKEKQEEAIKDLKSKIRLIQKWDLGEWINEPNERETQGT